MSGGAVATSGCSCTWGWSCRGLLSDGDSPEEAKSAAANGGGSAAEPPGGCRPLFVALKVASTISPAWASRRTHARGREYRREDEHVAVVTRCARRVCRARVVLTGVRPRWHSQLDCGARVGGTASWCQVVRAAASRGARHVGVGRWRSGEWVFAERVECRDRTRWRRGLVSQPLLASDWPMVSSTRTDPQVGRGTRTHPPYLRRRDARSCALTFTCRPAPADVATRHTGARRRDATPDRL